MFTFEDILIVEFSTFNLLHLAWYRQNQVFISLGKASMIFQYTETYTQCSRFRIYSFQHGSLSCSLPKVSVQDL